MYLVQASPLTKIFLADYREKCLDLLNDKEDPERKAFKDYVFRGDPFTVRVPRPCGAVELVHGRPVHAATLVPHVKERKIEEDEVSPLFAWLTEDGNHETDMWGVVAVHIETDISTALMAIVNESKGDDKSTSMIEQIKESLTTSITDARVRADERVRKHCVNMYNTVKETHDIMTREGKGVYSPSYSEALSMEILRDEIMRKTRHSKVSQENFSKTMGELNQQVGL